MHPSIHPFPVWLPMLKCSDVLPDSHANLSAIIATYDKISSPFLWGYDPIIKHLRYKGFEFAPVATASGTASAKRNS